MKLDRLKLAELIGYCANRGMTVDRADVGVIDDLTELEAPTDKADPVPVNDLLMCMAKGGSQLQAIKLYRELTGLGLEESHRVIKKNWKLEVNNKDIDYIASIIRNYFLTNGIFGDPIYRNNQADRLANLIVEDNKC